MNKIDEMIKTAMEEKKGLLVARKQLLKDNESLLNLQKSIEKSYKNLTDSSSYLYRLEKLHNKFGYNDYNYIDSQLWSTLFKKTSLDSFLSVKSFYLLKEKYGYSDTKNCNSTPIFNTENIKKVYNKTFLLNGLKDLISYVIETILRDNSNFKKSFKVSAYDTETNFQGRTEIRSYFYMDKDRFSTDIEKLACIVNNIKFDFGKSLLLDASKNGCVKWINDIFMVNPEGFDVYGNEMLSIKIQRNGKTAYILSDSTFSAFQELQQDPNNIKKFLN